MIQPDGNYEMIQATTLDAARRHVVEQAVAGVVPPGTLLVYGTESEVANMAAKVRLGHAEQEARRRRRQAQRASRKTNRPKG